MREVICNKCGKSFEIEELDSTKEKGLRGETLEVRSFTCPDCGNRYIIMVSDSESQNLYEEVRDIQNKLKTFRNRVDIIDPGVKAEQVRVLSNKLKSAKRKYLAYQSRLRLKYIKEQKRHGQKSIC